jgi:hypothetical protein
VSEPDHHSRLTAYLEIQLSPLRQLGLRQLQTRPGPIQLLRTDVIKTKMWGNEIGSDPGRLGRRLLYRVRRGLLRLMPGRRARCGLIFERTGSSQIPKENHQTTEPVRSTQRCPTTDRRGRRRFARALRARFIGTSSSSVTIDVQRRNLRLS